MPTPISIAELLRRLDTVDLVEETRRIVEANKEQLADMNREQLTEGLDATGKKMARYKNDAYARKKNRMNPKPGLGIRDQRLTGRFQEGIHVYTTGDRYTITSSDRKTRDIVRLDGEKVLGIMPDNRNEFRKNILRPGLIRTIMQKVKNRTSVPA